MATFGDIKSQVKAVLWPNGVPENLESAIDQFFVEGLIEMQRNIKCLQKRNETIYPGTSIYWRCGTSVFDKPQGRIEKVYTVWGTNRCNPVRYINTSVDHINCWSRDLIQIVDAPANVAMPVLELGFKFMEASTDSEFGRALRGMWAIDKDRIIIAPWIQSDESVVVQWSGLKRTWADADSITNDADILRCLRNWVKWSYESTYGCDPDAMAVARIQYDETLADLMIECVRETEQRKEQPCEVEEDVLWARWANDADEIDGGGLPPPTTFETRVYAAFGDFGFAGDDELAVSQLVKSWGPVGILALGDNNYPDGEAATIDANIGQYYADYIYPYTGSYPQAEDVVTNRFWPIPGNHDLDAVVGGIPAGPYLDYFTFLNGRRFYDFVDGDIHFFMIDSGFNTAMENVEPAGNGFGSIQEEYMTARIAQSVSKWKIICLHHTPFTSEELYAPGVTDLQWVMTLGVNLVLAGHAHNYERIERSGMSILINAGTGGAPLRGYSTIDPDSQARFSVHGALKITASCEQLLVEFYNTDGELLDSKDCGCSIAASQAQSGLTTTVSVGCFQCPNGPRGPAGPAGPAGPSGSGSSLSSPIYTHPDSGRQYLHPSGGLYYEITIELVDGIPQTVTNPVGVATPE